MESRISASAAGVRGLIRHLKGVGYLLSQSRFRSLLICIFDWIYLRHKSAGELWFELEGISLVVNWWFDVIYREKTG